MVEHIGNVAVQNRCHFLIGNENIEAGQIFVDGERITVAVRWHAMATIGDRPVEPVPVAEFFHYVLPRVGVEESFPLTDEIHKELLGLR